MEEVLLLFTVSSSLSDLEAEVILETSQIQASCYIFADLTFWKNIVEKQGFDQGPF